MPSPEGPGVLVSRWVPNDYTTLGTDGFGRSDTREALRRFFEVDAENIVAAALASLVRAKKLDAKVACDYIEANKLSPEAKHLLHV